MRLSRHASEAVRGGATWRRSHSKQTVQRGSEPPDCVQNAVLPTLCCWLSEVSLAFVGALGDHKKPGLQLTLSPPQGEGVGRAGTELGPTCAMAGQELVQEDWLFPPSLALDAMGVCGKAEVRTLGPNSPCLPAWCRQDMGPVTPSRGAGEGCGKGQRGHTRAVQLSKDVGHPPFPLLVHAVAVCSGDIRVIHQ